MKRFGALRRWGGRRFGALRRWGGRPNRRQTSSCFFNFCAKN